MEINENNKISQNEYKFGSQKVTITTIILVHGQYTGPKAIPAVNN